MAFALSYFIFSNTIETRSLLLSVRLTTAAKVTTCDVYLQLLQQLPVLLPGATAQTDRCKGTNKTWFFVYVNSYFTESNPTLTTIIDFFFQIFIHWLKQGMWHESSFRMLNKKLVLYGQGFLETLWIWFWFL